MTASVLMADSARETARDELVRILAVCCSRHRDCTPLLGRLDCIVGRWESAAAVRLELLAEAVPRGFIRPLLPLLPQGSKAFAEWRQEALSVRDLCSEGCPYSLQRCHRVLVTVAPAEPVPAGALYSLVVSLARASAESVFLTGGEVLSVLDAHSAGLWSDWISEIYSGTDRKSNTGQSAYVAESGSEGSLEAVVALLENRYIYSQGTVS